MPYPALPEYLFVDGGYLRKVCDAFAERYCDGTPIELDYNAFFKPHDKTFYYDCLPPRANSDTEETYRTKVERVERQFEGLRSLPGCHVFEGKTAGRRQKGVDIQIAVHMLLHVFRRNTVKVTLLAGDADFKPLVDALVMEGAQVTLSFEPTSAAKELIKAADIARPMVVYEVLRFTTSEFRQVYGAPNLSYHPTGVRSDMPLVKRGRCSSGAASLHQQGNVTMLVCPHPTNANQSCFIQFYDEASVRTLAEELGIVDIQWS